MMNTNTQNILSAIVIGGGVIAMSYIFLKKKKGYKSTKDLYATQGLDVNAKRPSTLIPKLIKNDLPNALENAKITLVDIPMRKFELVGDKRKKFLDEWIAEDDGVVSIKEMYKKRPTAFSKEDIAYLKSREIYLA